MSDLIAPIQKSAYVQGIVQCNEVIMGYFEDDLRKRRNTYKPKLKDTLEHKNAVGRLFKDILRTAMEEAA
tara:strand:- start:218 stop:427 length:210 start_codon:yes stop_codon:yes gene_type:complete